MIITYRAWLAHLLAFLIVFLRLLPIVLLISFVIGLTVALFKLVVWLASQGR